MRTIESIKKNEVVNCKTEEDAIEFVCLCIRAKKNVAHVNNWKFFESGTCFSLQTGKYSDKKYYEERGLTITDAKEFIAPTGEAETPQIDLHREYLTLYSNVNRPLEETLHILMSQFTLQRK